jgi:membrane-associated phospholipid phosphatase
MRTRIPPTPHWYAAAILAAGALAACTGEPAGPNAVPSNAAMAAPLAAPLDAPPVALEWHEVARKQVAANNMNALAAARLYAAVGVAQARAVAAVDAAAGVEGRGDGNGYGPGGRDLYEARRGAVAGASVRVLAWFSSAASTSLEQRLAEQGEAGPGEVHAQFTHGVAVGRVAGDAMVARLTNDGFTRTWTGSIPAGPGLWTTTVTPPAGVLLGEVTPYFLTANDQFRPADPPVYLSPAFNADLAQVVAITTSLTPAQRAIALGWAYGANTFTPPGYWDALAGQYIAAAGMDEAEATRVFAMMNAAVVDALIACFEAKFHFWTLRPHQADAAVPRVFTVPNYPAYPSGHGSVSSAAARVLAHFFPERAAELNTKVEEAALSRVYAGIHYFFDMTAARTLGEAVADFALSRGLP